MTIKDFIFVLVVSPTSRKIMRFSLVPHKVWLNEKEDLIKRFPGATIALVNPDKVLEMHKAIEINKEMFNLKGR
jgi:signal peptidase I